MEKSKKKAPAAEKAPESRNEWELTQFRKILNHSYDEIFVINNKGEVVYVNEACERNYGLKPEEIVGKTVYQLINEGYYYPLIAPLVLQEKKRATFEQETIVGKKLVVTATPILNDRDEVDLVVMNSRDITELENLKYNLEETKKQMEEYKKEVEELKKRENRFENFIVRSKAMGDCMELAQRVALADSTIIILGETGTGKSVLAKYIHGMSPRKQGPFQTINCAAIPEQLLESELFGYQSGAFTGANSKGKAGLLELANGGTLFLDEIAEIPIKLQAKILQVIQENKFIPVGGTKYKTVNIRIIAATNRDLEQMVKEGTFREDLYYRLNVIELPIAPLRERTEDIVPLAQFFLNKYDKRYHTSHSFSQDTLDILICHPWLGNVRELEHVIERLVLTVQESKILPKHLPKKFQQVEKMTGPVSLQNIAPLDLIEKELIIKAYKQLGSSYKVAKVLNISQSKANRKIRQYLSGLNAAPKS
ncbi:sigma-54 interaction domain-containing protein [Candidatus Formimonas warabiya]|uniref:sigma-54 interaction domain-containing protein n=1 Tax=Formimonas warabiya TaxID=1761012 RepID=UPI0011D09C14|nr:sigma 54-interacting transcriptional regulator [Candidatus Formimonas warabiya]